MDSNQFNNIPNGYNTNQFNNMPNGYNVNNMKPKKNHITILVVIFIIFQLLCCGGIFSVIWSLTDRVETIADGVDISDSDSDEESYNDYWEQDNYSYTEEAPSYSYSDGNILLDLNEDLPIEIELISLTLNTGKWDDEHLLKLQITNNSEYDNVEVDLHTSMSEESNVVLSLYDRSRYNVTLNAGETKVQVYEIYSYPNGKGNEIDIPTKGRLDIDVDIYSDDSDDYLSFDLTGGSIIWDEHGNITGVHQVDTWDYNSLHLDKSGEHIK